MAAESPDQIVVKKLFQTFCDDEYPNEDVDAVFERYAAMQVLKPKELTTDELDEGIVDGGGDGGIDSFYVFLNGALLSPDDSILTPDDASLRSIGSRPSLEVFLIQSKNVEKWQESVWEHLLTSLEDLLDAKALDVDLEKLYRVEVVERTGIFRRAVLSLSAKFPTVTFRVVYVTRAPTSNLTPTIEARSAKVAALVKAHVTTGATVSSEHVGVSELYQLAAQDHSKPAVLAFREVIREKDSFIGVVSLKDYLAFIRTPTGDLRDDLFELNVRDFEGDNEVNEAIADTLATGDKLEFWWLNNGVTVLGDEVDSPNKTLTISGPLIVNGLQTSHVLHRAAESGLLAIERFDDGIVVRVIKSVDEDTRDRVIAGTNRQTQVPGPALYATQPLQRDIERFLLVHDWYYERRKNRYRNQGKPARRRVTMGLMSQALITLSLGRPDDARARPSSLLTRKGGYDNIFSESLNMKGYLAALEIIKGVDAFLATEKAKAILDETSNTRFYVAAGYAILQLRLTYPIEFRFEKNFTRLSTPLKTPSLTKALTVLATTAADHQAKSPTSSRDSIFKSSVFRDDYFRRLARKPVK